MNFSERVLELTKEIPKGRVTTYKILAEKLDTKAYRAVGNSLHNNKKPYGSSDCKNQTFQRVPCHRVINSDGSLGGFSKGIEKKKRLLKKEGIEIKKNKIDLKKFLFRF